MDDAALATGGMTVTLHAVASDPAPGSGVATLLYVEYEYSQAAEQWVPLQNSDWVDYPTHRDDYVWRLVPLAGVKYLHAWAADGAGNISLFPFKAKANYGPMAETIVPDEGDIYRYNVEAGQQVTARLESISGDADLYVWAPDHDTRPPWVSNLTEGVDQVSFVAPVGGVYQVEVYGYTLAEYRLQVEVTAAGVGAAQLHPGATSDKPVLSQPLIPVASEPGSLVALPPSSGGANPSIFCRLSTGNELNLPGSSQLPGRWSGRRTVRATYRSFHSKLPSTMRRARRRSYRTKDASTVTWSKRVSR